MNCFESHVVWTLVDLCTRKIRGRVVLNTQDCTTLLRLYEAKPGYVEWDMPIKSAVRLSRLLVDPLSDRRRAVLIAAVQKGAAGQTLIYCTHKMAGDLLCLFDCDSQQAAKNMANRI